MLDYLDTCACVCVCVSPSVRNIYLDGKMEVGGERSRGQLKPDCLLHEVTCFGVF